VDALDMVLVAVLVLLLLRQVMPIAAGLAGGLALSSFGVLSRTLGWGAGRVAARTGTLARGALALWTGRAGSEEPLAAAAGETAPTAVPSWRDRV
jgi:type IV secretion system protein VirB6